MTPNQLPPLPGPFALSVSVHDGDTPAKTYVECLLYQNHPNEKQRLYTADQMHAYALAVLAQQAQEPVVSEDDLVACLISSGCVGTVKMSFESGPMSITRPSLNATKFARAILALRPAVEPMTDGVFDLICGAIDKADTVTMEGDYMMDSDDCIAVVRVMQALLSVRSPARQV